MPAAGESLNLYMVRSQNSSPVQEHLNRHGGRFATHLILKTDQRAQVKADIFLDSIRTVFSPYLVNPRGLAAFSEEPPSS
jgi:hypothetical protein